MGVEQLKVTLNHHCGDDLTTVNSARVSFNKASKWEKEFVSLPFGTFEVGNKLSDKDVKLISYLAKHKHYSPFGHSFASFTVEAPVFCRAQLVKHKFLRLNEVSRRYVDDDPTFYTPDVWRGRPVNKKQGSDGEVTFLRYLGFKEETVKEGQEKHIEYSLDLYKDMIEAGVAPEMARMVLPQNMMTSWWWSGSLDAFADMCKLRCKPDAQYETRMVAEQINTIMAGLYPVSWKELMNEL